MSFLLLLFECILLLAETLVILSVVLSDLVKTFLDSSSLFLIDENITESFFPISLYTLFELFLFCSRFLSEILEILYVKLDFLFKTFVLFLISFCFGISSSLLMINDSSVSLMIVSSENISIIFSLVL